MKHARRPTLAGRSGSTRTTLRATLCFVVVLGALSAASPARANPFDVFGFNPRGLALGGAMTALADDFSAVYYNPAGLAERQKVHFGLAFQGSFSALSIERQKPEGDNPSVLPPTHTGITVGAVFPLGAKIGNRIALGIGLYVPTSALFRLDAVDQTTPQFYKYQGLPAKLVIAPALAFRIHQKLKVGVGLLVLADLMGSGAFSVDPGPRRFAVARCVC